MSSDRFLSNLMRGDADGFSLDTDALARFDDIIDLSIGDTNLTTDERVINAAFSDALNGYTHYGDPKGDPELRSAVRELWLQDYGEELADSEVLITASAGIGLSAALSAVVNPGDEIIVFSPYYPTYAQAIYLASGVIKEVPLYAKEGFSLSRERLIAAITDKTKAILFNNPVNPTGALYEKSELEMLSQIATENDLLVISDEIYTEYVFDGEFTPLRKMPGMKDRTITLSSFSKNFQMTGWRVGANIADSILTEAMFHFNESSIYTAPIISQRAAIEALKLRSEICPRYKEEFRERIEYSSSRIDRIPWMTLVKPRGAYYLFPEIKASGLDSRSFCKKLLEDAHILLSPGSVFGSSGEHHVRIAASCAGLPLLEEAFDRMEKLKF